VYVAGGLSKAVLKSETAVHNREVEPPTPVFVETETMNACYINLAISTLESCSRHARPAAPVTVVGQYLICCCGQPILRPALHGMPWSTHSYVQQGQRKASNKQLLQAREEQLAQY
jgi:hypothetical protein